MRSRHGLRRAVWSTLGLAALVVFFAPGNHSLELGMALPSLDRPEPGTVFHSCTVKAIEIPVIPDAPPPPPVPPPPLETRFSHLP